MGEMQIRELTLEQMRGLYARRLTEDFPPDELKPIALLERAMARNEYVCYGAEEDGAILAYAFFVVRGRHALVDYYAVCAGLRDRGIGSRFLQGLIAGPLAGIDCALLEVEDPDCAAGDGEQMRRRIAFYLKNGLTDTGARAAVQGVPLRILALPVGGACAPEEALRVYAELYRAILPPELYGKWVDLRGAAGTTEPYRGRRGPRKEEE